MTALISNQLNLTRRYLIWCYKTTKESLDRIDRYYTQEPVDQFILEKLKESGAYKDGDGFEFGQKVNEFEKYIHEKISKADEKKFSSDKKIEWQAEYRYQHLRLKAIEEAITHFLGNDELEKIESLYDLEMTRRILESRDEH